MVFARIIVILKIPQSEILQGPIDKSRVPRVPSRSQRPHVFKTRSSGQVETKIVISVIGLARRQFLLRNGLAFQPPARFGEIGDFSLHDTQLS